MTEQQLASLEKKRKRATERSKEMQQRKETGMKQCGVKKTKFS